MDSALEMAARAVCEADPLSPEPDAPILMGTKRAKAWEPRAAILRQAIEAGLFAWPPKSWLAPWEATDEMAYEAVIFEPTSDYPPNVASAQYAAMRDAHLRTVKGEGKT